MTENVDKNLTSAKDIRLGDRAVFEQLFRSYCAPLTSYARFILKDAFVAEEIVQEVFLKLWENHDTIMIGISAKAYLYRAVHNHCVNYIKNARVNSRLSEEVVKEMIFHAELALRNFSESALEKLVVQELEDNLSGVIERLPLQCREIFLLNRQEELSYTQIASKLGISVNTVKTQIMRALDRLREAYKNF
jgi:RNA polymerase sigma-70 factor, ECF subfamily